MASNKHHRTRLTGALCAFSRIGRLAVSRLVPAGPAVGRYSARNSRRTTQRSSSWTSSRSRPGEGNAWRESTSTSTVALGVDPPTGREDGEEDAAHCCANAAIKEGNVSASNTHSLMNRYFASMGAEEDFSQFFEEDVTWLMVESGHEVRGAAPVRDYILDLHSRMHGGNQRPLVVADGHALLEGDVVNAGDGIGSGLSYCLVYDVSDHRITAMRCYGTLARLMPAYDEKPC